MAEKKQQKQSFNSLQDLESLLPKEERTSIIPKYDNKDEQNFYSFLHKRNRFFEKDVLIEDRPLKDHNKYNIKKITIENVVEDRSGRRPKPRQIYLLDEFKGWQNNTFYNSFAKRHQGNAVSICSKIEARQFKPNWRLAIGLGTGSVFETSISLHPIHGFPYIPATSLKGVVRSYLIANVFGTEGIPSKEVEHPLVNAEFRALTESKDFCRIFGCPNEVKKVLFHDNEPVRDKKDKNKYQYEDKTHPVALRNKDKPNEGEDTQGSIIFFDAYPMESPKDRIVADIMNPHYPEYYNDKSAKKSPTDFQNPIPILFLTVEKLAFQFIIGLKKRTQDFDIEIGEYKGSVLEQVGKMLKDALEYHGIGAKTAVGYGYMK